MKTGPIVRSRRSTGIRPARVVVISVFVCCSGWAAAAQIDSLPGAEPFDDALRARLARAVDARGEDYEPRTHHLREDGSPRFTNRLILETSPYLLQHAHNPVNWYPWGDEAFETARRLGRPVLLSVGYSTCHWCHVMESESFEDLEIARFLNEHYVAIKVDREERPDVDSIYMTAVQMMTGRGGWPMTVWLTPDREPFHGGTYFPARDGDRGSSVGFLTLLRRVAETYDADRGALAGQAERIAKRLRRTLAPSGGGKLPGREVLTAAAEYYERSFDPVHGGRSGSPKFPSGMPVRLLLREGLRADGASCTRMADRTLDEMADGGIHDPIGGGFHRYSTDAAWLVPHFEKMLYDNALLAVAYVEGYQATGRERFADVARGILDYLAREMTAPGGGFYSATDADSAAPDGHREEGRFFTWTPGEIRAVLDDKLAAVAIARYGVTAGGNLDGRSVLHVAESIEDVAREVEVPPERARRMLDEADAQLYRARSSRPAPLRDDKILTSWNGLTISAFAIGGRALDDAGYLETAERAASFVWNEMRKDGRLLRSYREGEARHGAYLDDYAFLEAGLLDLYEATSSPRWLERAFALQKVLDEHYHDDEAGGYFLTSDDHERLLAREKPAYDGAEPSGNSVAVRNLLRLYELTGDPGYLARADRALQAFAPVLERTPWALSEMLIALDFRLGEPREIVIVTEGGRDGARPFLRALEGRFVPNRVVVVAAAGDDLAGQSRLVPLLRDKVPRDGKPTAYVCRGGVCKLPTTDVSVFLDQVLARDEPAGATPTPEVAE